MSDPEKHDSFDDEWLECVLGEGQGLDPNDVAALAWGGGTAERRQWTRARLAGDPDAAKDYAVERKVVQGSQFRARWARAAALILLLLPVALWVSHSEAPQAPSAPTWLVTELESDAARGDDAAPRDATWSSLRPLDSEELQRLAGSGVRGPNAAPGVLAPRGFLLGAPSGIALSGAGSALHLALHDAVTGRRLAQLATTNETSVDWPADWPQPLAGQTLELRCLDANGVLLDSQRFELRDHVAELDAHRALAQTLPRALRAEALASAALRAGFYEHALQLLSQAPKSATDSRPAAFRAALAAFLGQ